MLAGRRPFGFCWRYRTKMRSVIGSIHFKLCQFCDQRRKSTPAARKAFPGEGSDSMSDCAGRGADPNLSCRTGSSGSGGLRTAGSGAGCVSRCLLHLWRVARPAGHARIFVRSRHRAAMFAGLLLAPRRAACMSCGLVYEGAHLSETILGAAPLFVSPAIFLCRDDPAAGSDPRGLCKLHDRRIRHRPRRDGRKPLSSALA